MKRRSNKTVIMVEGIHEGALTGHIYTRLSETLARIAPPPSVAKVIFADENGPKGGVDTRCTIVFHVPRRRDLSVTEVAKTSELAFDAAHAALAMDVTRESERRRGLVRRPKKYFLAKKLLAPEATFDASAALAEPSRPKRARRRRVA
jgi:hypothetical protein